MSGVILTAAVSLPPDTDLEAAAGEVVRRPERLDDLCRAGLAVAARALEGAGDLGRHALVLGTTLGCLESDAAYYSQVVELGLPRTNPRIFAYTLPNVVLGEVAIALKLTGDNLLLNAGRASGLTALAEAADSIRAGELDAALVLVLDPVGPAATKLFGALGTIPHSAAMAFLLESEARVVERSAPVLARIGPTHVGFDPEMRDAWPAEDRLSATGLDPLFGDLGASATLKARCSSGHACEVELLPPAPCVAGDVAYFPASWPIFRGHLPGNPLVPGAELVRVAAAVHGGALARIERFSFRTPIGPGDRVRVEWDDDTVTLRMGETVCAVGRLGFR